MERSSGAPGWRGPGAVAGKSVIGGGSLATVLVPSGRGAPGAVGLAAGLKASPRRPGAGGGWSCSIGPGGLFEIAAPDGAPDAAGERGHSAG